MKLAHTFKAILVLLLLSAFVIAPASAARGDRDKD